MFNKILLILFSIGISLNIFAVPATGEGLIPEIGCYKDYNKNSSLDSGEFKACAKTPQGYLCLLDKALCAEKQISAKCPSKSSLNKLTDRCEYAVRYLCTSTGSTYQTTDACSNNCTPSENCKPYCPDSMTLKNDLCVANPICKKGKYDTKKNLCVFQKCPYGDKFICRKLGKSNYCSRLSCMDSDDAISQLGSKEGIDNLYDNGPKSDENICLGQIYIFSGKDRRCRTWGATIAFDDCCQSEDYLFGLAQCRANELILAELKGEGLCHYVGEYCSKKIDLGFTNICVERSKTYCCFNSKLARIVQEQGREQLSTFSGWGKPKRPDCRGLASEEFQMLDFSLIDLSEWHGDIQTQSQAQIENNLQQGVEDFYNQIGN